jgi:hypothetical protein
MKKMVMIFKYVIYQLLIIKKKKKILNSFSNTYIAPRILLALLFIVVFVERKLKKKKLKLIKSYFKLIGLGILSIENEILAKL